MNRKVKRYDPINSDGTCGMCIEDADYGAYVEYADYAALEDECDSRWLTYVALVDKLGIENDRLRAGTQMLIGDLERRDATIDGLRAELAALKGSGDSHD